MAREFQKACAFDAEPSYGSGGDPIGCGGCILAIAGGLGGGLPSGGGAVGTGRGAGTGAASGCAGGFGAVDAGVVLALGIDCSAAMVCCSGG